MADRPDERLSDYDAAAEKATVTEPPNGRTATVTAAKRAPAVGLKVCPLEANTFANGKKRRGGEPPPLLLCFLFSP
jgi:hypothetical protein